MHRHLTALVLVIFTSAAAAGSLFDDVASEVGVAVESNSDIGPGCAFTDIEGDGDLDIMVVDGLGDPNVMLRQDALRSFSVASVGVGDTGWGKSVVFGDLDNDGDLDLVHSRFGQTPILYRNDGGTFTDVSGSAGFNLVGQFSGVALADYNNDGLLDIYMTRYAQGNNYLLKNLGGLTFQNATLEAGVADSSGFGFQPAWLDYDNDGDMDLYTSNDIFGTGNVLFRNDGDGTFTDVAAASGTNLDMSAMGLAVADYNNDGWIDIYVTNTVAGNVLLHNNGDGTFSDKSAELGIEANVICWGTEFFDYDNDGFLDLYVNVASDDYRLGPDGRFTGGSEKSAGPQIYPNLLYHNNGSTFDDVSAGSGVSNGGRSFCSAVGDYDADGDLDVYITNWHVVVGDSSSALFENKHIPRGSADDDWLRVKLIGTTSNRDGIGARVWIHTENGWQYRERHAGSSYNSCSEPFVHFGIGQASVVDQLFVRWPSGLVEQYESIPPGQMLTLIEGEGTTSSADDRPALGALLTVAPNPARRGAEVRLQLGASEGRVQIVDVRGRLLRTLAFSDGGRAPLRWDGRDDRGEPLPAGSYFMKLWDGSRPAGSKKMVLLD